MRIIVRSNRLVVSGFLPGKPPWFFSGECPAGGVTPPPQACSSGLPGALQGTWDCSPATHPPPPQ